MSRRRISNLSCVDAEHKLCVWIGQTSSLPLPPPSSLQPLDLTLTKTVSSHLRSSSLFSKGSSVIACPGRSPWTTAAALLACLIQVRVDPLAG